ncbi:MAG: peptidase [unclassified Hahellaceae]|nr:peptidase [Hahellaceae bacterium]|tara:strand:- start:41209 stop:42624 length:1416 start_codon:yes stop_codon:yes gene_type:complete
MYFSRSKKAQGRSSHALLAIVVGIGLAACQTQPEETLVVPGEASESFEKAAPAPRPVATDVSDEDEGAAPRPVTPDTVAAHYPDLALAIYADSLTRAEALLTANQALIADPSEETLNAAREAWIAARVPYQQSEVFRFGNPQVDEWEGRVNAWPLDEGLIDYVASSYGTASEDNPFYTANVIANKSLKIGTGKVDATTITPNLLQNELQEIAGNEANVATGYHAIEFLLWGQDLNGTGPGAGERPYTDYSTSDCTNGNCERRGEYLIAASELLISDLRDMVTAWGPDGEIRQALESQGSEATLAAMLTGMGSLSYGELAGERMQLGLMLHDPEEEHDCFSDNTHFSHYYDAAGIQNIFEGRYRRIDGSVLAGPSLEALLKKQAPKVALGLDNAISQTMDAMSRLVNRAEKTESYDQMIGAGNAEGNAVVQKAVDTLVNQTRYIEQAVAALNLGTLTFEGSDSLDQPEAVFE